jgi:Ca2+-binding RTX toxin-like protein
MATLVLSSNTLAENAQTGALVGTLSVTGEVAAGETFTFALTDERFQIINGNQLVVKSGSFDFEGLEKQFTLNIQAVGSQGTTVDAAPVVINLANVNEAPTGIVVTGGTIGDNAIIGAIVATLAGNDPDKGDQLTYTLVTDATGATEFDHPYFRVYNGEIVVASDLSDAPVGESLPVYVKVSDAKGLSFVKEVSLSVIPVNEAPEIIPELKDVLDGSKGGTVVATIKADDPDSPLLTYKLANFSDQWLTLIDNGNDTYNVVVKQGFTVNSSRTAFQSFTIEVSDGENTTTDVVYLNINENLEPEANFQFIAAERTSPAGTIVGTLMADDPEGQAVSYVLSQESAQVFQLVRNADGTSNVAVKAGVTLDYTLPEHQSFTVTVSDGFNSFDETFDVVFWDKAPVGLSALRVSEGVQGSVVGRLTALHPDDETVDCILSVESAKLFKLVSDNAGGYSIVLREGIALDYENQAHHNVTLTVTDGTNALTKRLALSLTDEIDVFTGTASVDSLNGTAGRDIIKGLAGNDTLVGNAGNDKLYGGAGKDVLNGGAGQDVFVFDSKPNKKTNLDKVAEFSVTDDSIWLENKVFAKLGKKGSEAAPAQLKKSFFVLGDKAKDKDDYIIYSKKTGRLYFDVDGSGSKAAVEIATLSKKLAMTYKDFFVI